MATTIQPFLDSAAERMDKSVQHFTDETRGIRTGRASAGLLDSVRVDYYGTKTPLSQIANVAVTDARTLAVKPYDQGALKDVEKAITAAGLGLNPTVDGPLVRINIPALSEEQRTKLASRVKALAEEGKVSMRNVRRDVLREMETEHKEKKGDVVLTDDDMKSGKDKVQEILKDHESRLDELCKNKCDEIMTV